MANGQDLVYVENWNGTFDKTTVSNGQLRLVAQPPTFTRNSVAYKSNGTQVAANVPRFEPGKFGQAIMVEEGTTNLLSSNQASIETDASGFSAYNNVTFMRDTSTAWQGTASLKVVTPGTVIKEGVHTTQIVISANTIYTASAYVKGSGNLAIYIDFFDSSLAYLGSSEPTYFSPTNTWIRYTASGMSPTNAQYAWVMVRTDGTPQAVTFWVDGVQLEQKPYATSFIDGTRAAETLTIPTAGVINKDEGTIKLWINPLVVQDYNNFFLMDISTGRFLLYFSSGGNVYWDYGTANSMLGTGSGIAVAGQWLHVVMRWSATAGTRSLFINGQLIGTQSFTPPTSLPDIVSVVNSYSAYIDDLQIYNRALTDVEIAADYNSGVPSPIDEYTTYKLNFDNNLDFNVYGTYYTNPIDLSSVVRIKSTAIGWSGTNVRVLMSISKNGGITWGSWYDVTNGGVLPNLSNNLLTNNIKIKFMITLIKNDATNPNCSNFIAEIYTLTIEEAVHYQKIRNLYIKIDLLDKNDIKIGELTGTAIDGSVDVNSSQSIRRTCDVKFYLTNDLIPSSSSEIWIDKRFRLWIGLEDILTGEIVYFNLGIFVIGDPQIDVTINQRTIEIKGYDKMCLLDGTIGGQLSNIVNIPLNTSITQAITSTMQQIAGENKLLIDSMKDSNNNDILTPYTIEVDVTKTIYDVINQLGSLYMYYEFFYDVNGYFVFRKRRDLYNDPIIWDFTTYDFRVQSSCQLSFTNVKNYITVYGATLSDGSQPSYTLSISDTLYPDFPYTIEKIGKRTLTISENNYFTTSQCQSRAEYEAWLHTNFNDKLTIYCAPIYSLDVNSLIYLDYPNDGVSGKYTISEINIPLKYDTTMSITAYKVYEQTNTFT